MAIVIGVVIFCIVLFIIASILDAAEARRRDEALHAYLTNKLREEASSVSQATIGRMQQASDAFVSKISEITRR